MINPWAYEQFGRTVASSTQDDQKDRVSSLTKSQLEAALTFPGTRKSVLPQIRRLLLELQREVSIPFQMDGFAVFGDSVNGWKSAPAVFKLNGKRFVSSTPFSRVDATEINGTVHKIRNALKGKL